MCTYGVVRGNFAYCIVDPSDDVERDDAEDTCVAWGGHLVTIQNEAVWNTIKTLPLWNCLA